MTQASAVRTRCPAGLVAAIRGATGQHADWQQTAELVADQLRLHLPGPEILTASEREGSAGRVRLPHPAHRAGRVVLGLRAGVAARAADADP